MASQEFWSNDQFRKRGRKTGSPFGHLNRENDDHIEKLLELRLPNFRSRKTRFVWRLARTGSVFSDFPEEGLSKSVA